MSMVMADAHYGLWQTFASIGVDICTDVIIQACQVVEAWHVISITICQLCNVAVPIDGPEVGMRGIAGALTCSITL